MTRTPWGDATELRERMLRPGRGTPREEAEKNQRERLFAAMVATVADKGYEATTVADLVNLSGVSRSAFYRHFADKEECFLTAAEAMIGPTLEAIRSAESGATGEDRTRKALEAFLTLIASQPGASKMCFVEVYAAGPAGVTVVEKTLNAFEEFVSELFAEIPDREKMPPQMIRAMIGGLQKVIHKRLYRDEEDQLMELAPQIHTWWLSYPPPPGSCGRRAGAHRNRAPSRSDSRSPTPRSGCCARWPRRSPRRVIRRRPSPRSSIGPPPRSAPSTSTSRTKKRR